MPSQELDETLFPKVEVGSKIVVWCLEFPPERRGNECWTRLLEEVEVEIVKIEQHRHRHVLGRDASGREFHTWIATEFEERNRIKPGFIVPASIKNS